MSTGHPIKNSSDLNKVKQDYLETLRLQAKLNQQNLEANRLYLQTGQLPPSSQMADTRSVEEKLMDIEYLKQRIIKELSTIADPAFASNVVNAVLNSPLNIDNKLFRFFAQNITGFVEQLKKRYGIGIKGDVNDVQIMVNFLNTLFTETQGSMQSVSDYAKSTTNVVQTTNMLSVNDLNTIVMNLREMVKRLTLLKAKEPLVNEFNTIIDMIKYIANVLPSQEGLNEMIKIIDTNPTAVAGANDSLISAFKILETLPKPNIVYTQIDIINRFIEAGNNIGIRDGLLKLKDYFSNFIDEENIAVLTDFERIWKTQSEQIYNKNMRDKNLQTLAQIREERDLENAPVQKVFVVNQVGLPEIPALPAPPAQQEYPELPAPQEPDFQNMTVREFTRYIDNILQGLRDEDLDIILRGMRDRNLIGNIDQIITRPDKINQIKLLYRQNRRRAQDPFRLNMYGLGITNEKPRLKRGRGISTYKPLGGSLVNVDSLDKGLLTLRRQTKSNYPDIPSKRISPKLQGILQTIVGGGMPKFNDLNGLDDDEKDYLYKIMKKSNLTDKLSVPAPSKDQEEKDIHQFEVMKGQILSGNDSKDLVKRFKALMLKLVKKGLLPKNDVIELMDDLHTLGY